MKKNDHSHTLFNSDFQRALHTSFALSVHFTNKSAASRGSLSTFFGVENNRRVSLVRLHTESTQKIWIWVVGAPCITVIKTNFNGVPLD